MAESKNSVHGHRFKDETGNTYGTLLVLRYAGQSKTKRSQWWCRCSVCGREVIADGVAMRCGNTSACRFGCGRVKHGAARRGENSKEFRTWASIIQRCENPKNANYKNYGGRGIRMCARWRESFAAFLEDMGPRPAGHSIDRFPDNDGPYAPDNCRWATKREQDSNQRPHAIREPRPIEYKGETKSIRQWARLVGIKAGTLRARVFVLGWSIERAMTTTAK